MDITVFSEENFDTKEWLNKILEEGEKQDKKENYTMSLVMKLQLYVQQVNKSLEETSQEVLSSLPKIIRNTKQLQEEAEALRFKMGVVQKEITIIENETGKSINTIEKLDNMKNKLEIAKQGLHESDNWAILVNDLEDVFDTKNIEQISRKILGMQQSLKLLVNVSDYEVRKMQLEGLKNRLEAIASPLIVQAFTSNNTENAKVYAEIFTSIERLPQLMKYYHKCQKEVLLKKWRASLEKDQDESVSQWMHTFYNLLISNWHTQNKWFNQVFSNQTSTETLVDIYIDMLTSLDPSFNECIDAALKQVADKLSLLQEIKQTIIQFCNNLNNVIKQTAQVRVDSAKILLLFQAVCNPFISYVNKYGAYEQAHLLKKLSSVNFMQEELSDTIQNLGLSVPSVMDIARESRYRCADITENCGYCGLLIALRAFFSKYVDHFRVALRQIERNKKNVEDWTTLQLCFSLLQISGDVLLKVKQFEKELTETVLEDLNRKFEDVEFKYLILNKEDRREFESLVKCVTEGTKLSLLDHISNEFVSLCSDIHDTTYQVVLSPISSQLNVVQSSKTWAQFANSSFHTSDMPDYSLSPQEYITEIGQYLMTLPQHLEPFLFRDNPSLSYILRAINEEYSTADDTEGALATVFLKLVAKGTCQAFSDKILSICELNYPASRQLSHDIGYLSNVMQDLGLTISDNLQQLSVLLKIPADQYQSQSSGYSARNVAAIRQMRNILSN
ncbi:conserved oligomeric Golgi complex subunit 7 [Coccinella septempunctata]|uniref:conserved oligomeric Golgi complex subunit 7 n=1 Tax=Coccinella septempunctata TaxID=41139 RepID=UPI001D08E449|nr:conserved oligomeric Golgi complex subunit 7 [Coccinella septempunctata]